MHYLRSEKQPYDWKMVGYDRRVVSYDPEVTGNDPVPVERERGFYPRQDGYDPPI